MRGIPGAPGNPPGPAIRAVLMRFSIAALSSEPPCGSTRPHAAREIAGTLREIGRVERMLFVVDWLLDADMQRRANTGLNKGEAHHAPKNALRTGRQGRNPLPLERGPALPKDERGSVF